MECIGIVDSQLSVNVTKNWFRGYNKFSVDMVFVDLNVHLTPTYMYDVLVIIGLKDKIENMRFMLFVANELFAIKIWLLKYVMRRTKSVYFSRNMQI